MILFFTAFCLALIITIFFAIVLKKSSWGGSRLERSINAKELAIMIGAELSYGWGQRLAVNSYQLPPVIGDADFHTYQVMVIVAGSTSLRALKRVVEDVKNVVKEPSPQKPVLEPKPQAPASDPAPQKPL